VNKPQAIDRINASLREGAELRTIVARDCSEVIIEAASLIISCLQSGGKLLFFGNGGGAADAQHLAAEFVERFVRERAGLPALALTTDSSILTQLAMTMDSTKSSPEKFRHWLDQVMLLWPLAPVATHRMCSKA
jgi:D-sedoheptulose 7-phosphate isomerase